MSTQQFIQAVSLVGGAVITALAGYYTALQQRKQNQLTALLTALQQDNRDLREENRALREELDAKKRSIVHENRQH